MTREAQILLGPRVIFAPKGDGYSFNMIASVPHLNETIKFGELQIDKDFIEFLKSPFAPEGHESPDRAWLYFRSHDLDITDPSTYAILTSNLETIISGDTKKIDEFINRGVNNASLKVSLDEGEVPDSPKHEELTQAFNDWKEKGKGRVSEPIPHLANKKTSKGEGYGKK